MTAHIMFAANLGLFLSVVCRSTTRAYVVFALVLLTLTGGMWALDYLADRASVRHLQRGELEWSDPVTPVANLLNPVQTWSALARDPRESRHHRLNWEGSPDADAVAMVLPVILYAVAACALWFAARWRFNRETGHV
jgi:hypothetical protein